MYPKYLKIQKAWEVFENMHDVRIVSCYVMTTGYTQNMFYEKDSRYFSSKSMIITSQDTYKNSYWVLHGGVTDKKW